MLVAQVIVFEGQTAVFESFFLDVIPKSRRVAVDENFVSLLVSHKSLPNQKRLSSELENLKVGSQSSIDFLVFLAVFVFFVPHSIFIDLSFRFVSQSVAFNSANLFFFVI